MASENPTLVTYQDDGPITIGTLCNSTMLDGSAVTKFGAQVLSYVTDRSSLQLLLDFENVDYLSSAALTELIKINDAVVGGGGRLRICGLAPQIHKVFQITKFDKVFEIQPNEKVDHSTGRFKRALELSREEDDWEQRHDSS